MFEVRRRTAGLTVHELRGETYGQPVVHFLVDAGIDVRALVIRIVNHAGVVQVGNRGHIGGLLVAALEAQLVVHREDRAEDVVLPVVGDALGVVYLLAGADNRTYQRIELLAAVIVLEPAHVLLEADELVGTHGFDALHRLGDGELRFVGDMEFALRTPLGLDQDDAVRAARTVDGHGRRVFQHRHVLDDVRVEVGQSARVGNAVENDQRVVAGRQ